ncbi:hypothetical protein DFH07DRAFT_769015 [Mycena maculata]|uniref:Uncharacterized protein n=1 Tax=Mycena maculata TaxID=230809 RepID=A0AAD7JRS5_9AGAR|nr:hypothetical protein DFH07DRAFT_769015 [Mycena maculata]
MHHASDSERGGLLPPECQIAPDQPTGSSRRRNPLVHYIWYLENKLNCGVALAQIETDRLGRYMKISDKEVKCIDTGTCLALGLTETGRRLCVTSPYHCQVCVKTGRRLSATPLYHPKVCAEMGMYIQSRKHTCLLQVKSEVVIKGEKISMQKGKIQGVTALECTKNREKGPESSCLPLSRVFRTGTRKSSCLPLAHVFRAARAAQPPKDGNGALVSPNWSFILPISDNAPNFQRTRPYMEK